jgi:ABC-type multidrug transport system fused ATPase/permease subunit
MSEPNGAKKFLAQETRFQGGYARSMAETLYQAYRPAFARTVILLLLGIAGRFALLGNTNLVGYWVDSFCRAPAPCHPLPRWLAGFRSADFLLLLSAATALGFVLTMAFRAGVSRLSAEAVSRIYDETTYRTSRLPMSFFDQNPAGRVMTRFTSDYNNIFRIFGGPLAEFIGLTFDLFAMTVLITVASPWLLPLWALQGLLNYLVYRFYLGALRRERRDMALKRSPGIAHFAETTSGASTIRAFGREGMFQRRFSSLNDDYLEQRLRTTSVFVRFSLGMTGATALVLLLTGLASMALVERGLLTVGAVGVAFAYLGLSSNILQSFFEWLGQFEEALTGLERMNEYLRLPLEDGARLPSAARFPTGHPREEKGAAGSAAPDAPEGQGAAVEVDGLWMRYRPDLPPILQGIELAVRPGERIAVVGRTGSGKTSLVQALYRLYPPEQGCIRVAGREAATSTGGELDLRAYRRQMAYITQEATLFLGSIRENLIGPGEEPLTDPAANRRRDDRLIQAMKRVQFLREGATDEEYAFWLDYPVEERGKNLSAGERQLLCMARCLLQDAPVVILDEATSAVDPRSEEVLTRATETFFRGKTQLIIAHRLSTVRSCERVLWLQQGKVHRLGPPEAVLPEFEQAELNA